MLSAEIEKELRREMDALSESEQRRVLDFARSLKSPRKGVLGALLIEILDPIPPDDLKRMKAVIEEDCERIDDDAPPAFA